MIKNEYNGVYKKAVFFIFIEKGRDHFGKKSFSG